jgi:2-oxoglutarate dehydrogenase E2 component (dihydrolipoamide succinyltransferase)
MTQTVTRVIMPQMGESIAEATISRWHVQPGSLVREGDPMLDISTAKIESEIPAPATGIIAALLAAETETVPVDALIALIVPEGTDLARFDVAAHAEGKVASAAAVSPAPAASPVPAPKPEPVATPSHPAAGNGCAVAEPAAAPPVVNAADIERERIARVKRASTPLVRNIAQDLGINLADVHGTGNHGRVTKRDLEAHLAEQKKLAQAHGVTIQLPPAEQRPTPRLRPGQVKLDSVQGPFDDPIEVPALQSPISMMRRLIAENLTRSSQTIPHAYTCHEVDFTQLEKLRLRYRSVFETQFNTRLTPLVFLLSAVSDALLKFPSINASWAGDRIIKHRVVNIGVAVALKEGLVVPVLRNVESMSLAGIARGLVDLGTRARSNQLKPADMEGGTFSITSPGQLGAVFAIPIIMPPQGGIIHLGAIQKIPCVVTGPDGQDSIAIRQRAMVTLGIDHRLIDGWEADQFMIAIKDRIERADFGLPA